MKRGHTHRSESPSRYSRSQEPSAWTTVMTASYHFLCCNSSAGLEAKYRAKTLTPTASGGYVAAAGTAEPEACERSRCEGGKEQANAGRGCEQQARRHHTRRQHTKTVAHEMAARKTAAHKTAARETAAPTTAARTTANCPQRQIVHNDVWPPPSLPHSLVQVTRSLSLSRTRPGLPAGAPAQARRSPPHPGTSHACQVSE